MAKIVSLGTLTAHHHAANPTFNEQGQSNCPCAVCTRLAAASPIGALPNELLPAIFASLPRSGVIRASQVCRRWRVLALAHRALWTDVVCTHPRLTQLMIARARTSLLRVRFRPFAEDADADADEDEDEDLQPAADTDPKTAAGEWTSAQRIASVTLALADMSRVCSIDLLGGPRAMAQLLPLLVAQPAPQLRSLRLRLTGFFADLSLPPGVFADTCPRLARVAIANILPDLLSPVFTAGALTHLSLGEIALYEDATAAQLHHVLMCSPALTHLALRRGALPPDGWDTARTIELPLLESLALQGNKDAVRALLSILRTPAGTRLALETELVPPRAGGPADDPDIAPILAHIQRASAPALRAYLSSTWDTVVLQYWTDPPTVDPDAAPAPQIALEFRHGPGLSAELRADLAHTLARSLPLSRVRLLSLGALDTLDAFLPLFHKMRDVRALRVAPRTVPVNPLYTLSRDLADMNVGLHADHGAGEDARAVDMSGVCAVLGEWPAGQTLPNLRSLDIVGAVFRRGGKGGKFYCKAWDAFVACLHARQQSETMVRRVHVVNCEGVGELKGRPACVMVVKRLDGEEEVLEGSF